VTPEPIESEPSESEISARLIAFIRERFLDGDAAGELDETSPLLEWGVINSLNSVILLSFISEEFGTPYLLENIDATTFKSVRNMTLMLSNGNQSAHQ
jgi:clorobiocin biosynthesis protein CloN5